MRRGLGGTAGLVNGRGRVNGLLDRHGFVNGSVLIHTKLPKRTLAIRYAALAVSLLFTTATTAFLFAPAPPGTGFTVDGSFSDWSTRGLVPFTGVEPAATPTLTLDGYAAHRANGHLYLWLETEDSLFADPLGVDTVHVLLDGDGDPATGYTYEGLGADFRIHITGSSGTVRSSGLFAFHGDEAEDWNAWRGRRAVDAALSGRSLEIDVRVDGLDGFTDRFLAAFLVEGNGGDGSASTVAVGQDAGAIRIHVELDTDVATEGATVGQVVARHYGTGSARIDVVAFDVDGRASMEVGGLPVTLTPASSEASLPIEVLRVQGVAGEAVLADIAVVTATVPVTVADGRVAVYLLNTTDERRIDGLFADWANATRFVGQNPWNSDVDLVAHGAAAEGGTAFFFAEVEGTALRGGRVPHTDRLPPADTGGAPSAPPATPPRMSAEDRLRILVDEDPGAGTGVGAFNLLADWSIEVLGRHGRVNRVAVRHWEAGGWVPFELDVDVAVRGARLELSADPLDLAASASVVLEMSDWRGEQDRTSVFSTRGTRGDIGEGPQASSAPTWPTVWNSAGTDADDGIVDTTLEILEVHVGGDSEYLFVRIEIEGSSPTLTDNSWWVYLDLTGDGNNDWLIQELSTEVCSYQWDTGNTNWGVLGGCDATATITDGDVGSAVRAVTCGSSGCIDFAL
jgi:hypothetical protein